MKGCEVEQDGSPEGQCAFDAQKASALSCRLQRYPLSLQLAPCDTCEHQLCRMSSAAAIVRQRAERHKLGWSTFNAAMSSDPDTLAEVL